MSKYLKFYLFYHNHQINIQTNILKKHTKAKKYKLPELIRKNQKK